MSACQLLAKTNSQTTLTLQNTQRVTIEVSIYQRRKNWRHWCVNPVGRVSSPNSLNNSILCLDGQLDVGVRIGDGTTHSVSEQEFRSIQITGSTHSGVVIRALTVKIRSLQYPGSQAASSH